MDRELCRSSSIAAPWQLTSRQPGRPEQVIRREMPRLASHWHQPAAGLRAQNLRAERAGRRLMRFYAVLALAP